MNPNALRLLRLARGGRGLRSARSTRGARPGEPAAGKPASSLPETTAPVRPGTVLPETTAPLSGGSAGSREITYTRAFRRERLAQREVAQTAGRGGPSDTAARRVREQGVNERSAVRDPNSQTGTADAPLKPREPLLPHETRSRLVRGGAYAGLGLAAAGGLTGLGILAQEHFLTPMSDNRVREADASRPTAEDHGPCAKIVIGTDNQSQVVIDEQCQEERRLAQGLDPEGAADLTFWERLFGQGEAAAGDGFTTEQLTTAPPTLGERIQKVASGILLLTIAGAAAYGAWWYYKKHPDKFPFKKKGGTLAKNPVPPEAKST